MLPDFPKIKKKILKNVNKYTLELTQQDPIMSQIKQETIFEGDRTKTFSMDGELDEGEFDEISSGIEVTRKDVIEKGPKALIENIERVAEEIKKQKAKLLLKKVKEITDKTGNIVDGKGRPFTHETYLECLEKIWIDFDENGKPDMLTLVVSPQLKAKIIERIPEWEKNPDFIKRYDEIIEQKRKEWHDRQSHRKLVD